MSIRRSTRFFSLVFVLVVSAILLVAWPGPDGPPPIVSSEGFGKAPGGEKASGIDKIVQRAEAARERAEFEFLRLRDPKTGAIPASIQRREMEFARTLDRRQAASSKRADPIGYTRDWTSIGPYNVGGRTRALAVDRRSSSPGNTRILAGGVSGGVYLSDDMGASWTLTTGLDQFAGVSSLAQDPNDPEVWYAGAGEYLSGSAGGVHSAKFLGHGLYKSTDGGESWFVLEGSVQNTLATMPDSPFDFVWKVLVTQNGDLLVATRQGILASRDGGNTFELALSSVDENGAALSSDVIQASDGSV